MLAQVLQGREKEQAHLLLQNNQQGTLRNKLYIPRNIERGDAKLWQLNLLLH